MPSSIHSSTCGLNNDCHSYGQMSSVSSKTFRSFSSLESYHTLEHGPFSSPASSQDLSSVTSMSSQPTSENLEIHEYQTTEASIPTVSTSSSFEMRGDSYRETGRDSSSRDLEVLVISSADTPFYSMDSFMEQEAEETVPETSEWRELLDALEVERRRAMTFHSMSPMARFLSYERVEDCSVELRIWGTGEQSKQEPTI